MTQQPPYAGRPFGEESLVSDLAKRFGRYWARGRPVKETTLSERKEDTQLPEASTSQFPLF